MNQQRQVEADATGEAMVYGGVEVIESCIGLIGQWKIAAQALGGPWRRSIQSGK